jgi:hypothetical protein
LLDVCQLKEMNENACLKCIILLFFVFCMLLHSVSRFHRPISALETQKMNELAPNRHFNHGKRWQQWAISVLYRSLSLCLGWHHLVCFHAVLSSRLLPSNPFVWPSWRPQWEVNEGGTPFLLCTPNLPNISLHLRPRSSRTLLPSSSRWESYPNWSRPWIFTRRGKGRAGGSLDWVKGAVGCLLKSEGDTGCRCVGWRDQQMRMDENTGKPAMLAI